MVTSRALALGLCLTFAACKESTKPEPIEPSPIEPSPNEPSPIEPSPPDLGPPDASGPNDADLGSTPTDDGGSAPVPDMAYPGIDTQNPLYPIYAGCEAPATSYARTIYVDPVNGSETANGAQATPLKTLQAAFTAKKLLPGDHVVLLPGDHGAPLVSMYSNPELKDGAVWLWLDVQPGAKLTSLTTKNMSRWLITRAEVTGAATKLISLNDGANIVLADADLYTVRDASAWGVNEWINTASWGIVTRNVSCASLLRNKLTNVRFGITISTDSPAPPQNSAKTLIMGNDIISYSADGMRPNASDILAYDNRILDCYVSIADGDGNHDDAIQMFALTAGGNPAAFENITIDKTFVQDRSSATRAYLSDAQGISVFDGTITRLVIKNNVVIAGAYHGISIYGGKDCVIEHNTVASSAANGRDLWIGVFNNKDGTPPDNTIARNNVAAKLTFSATSGYTASNNYAIKTADAPANYEAYDLAGAQFDLRLRSTSSAYGKGAGAW